MKAKKTIFVALAALAAALMLGSCGNPNASSAAATESSSESSSPESAGDSTGGSGSGGGNSESSSHAGTYTSETNSTTLIIKEDGTCSFTAGENGGVSASGTYVLSSDGNSATVTFPKAAGDNDVTLTATTTDGWTTFKTTSETEAYSNMTFTKQN